MKSPEPSWVAPLREALAGASRPGVEVARGSAPGLLAADTSYALTSALFTALIIAATRFRAQVGQAELDLIAVLLRTASVAFAVRTAFAVGALVKRLLRDRRAEQHALAWSSDGLFHRTPSEERWVARDDVLGLAVPEQPARRTRDDSLQPLFVVLRPTGQPVYWELPPYFASSASILLARLERWLGPRMRRADPSAPTDPAEQRYLRATQDAASPGDVVVPEGFGYRRRAPFGTLLALVFVADAVRSAGPYRERLIPAAGAAALLACSALVLWFAWMRRRRAARLGIALLLTPEELLVRGRHGIVSMPWTQLTGSEVRARLAWSPFTGAYTVRVLWFSAADGSETPFDGAFLGVPPEVVATLAEAYREGRVVDASDGDGETPPSHGSGAGGGSSGTLGATASPTSATAPSRSIEKRRADSTLERSTESCPSAVGSGNRSPSMRSTALAAAPRYQNTTRASVAPSAAPRRGSTTRAPSFGTQPPPPSQSQLPSRTSASRSSAPWRDDGSSSPSSLSSRTPSGMEPSRPRARRMNALASRSPKRTSA